jgi:ATP-dependent exoDNAse (exonuclease V) beta subunit
MKDFERLLLIVANAGSGKTYRLVTRCLDLLARGQPPEKILALTFTRKAAAEFLEKLFDRLAEAALDPRKLADLRDALGMPEITREDCLAWLRRLVAVLPRLSMGTMDQFFGRIARAFPFELGLGREFQVMDEAAQEEGRRRALDEFFRGAVETPQGLAQFVELLRQQSRNKSGQSVLRTIERTAASLHEGYLDTPKGMVWGDVAAIWPQGSVILSAAPVEEAAAEFWEEAKAANPGLGDEARVQWEVWLELACAHRPPRRMDEALEKFATEKLVKTTADNKSGELYVPVGRKGENRLYLRGRLPELREALRLSLVRLEVEAKLAESRALHAIVGRYEEVYHAAVRETGALTFADIAMLLAGDTDAPWRRDLDYRLDGRHDHWLLDEFQDTSRTQWKIMEPLADEIIQDTSGARSFFYVGDTKQAIYGWRGGDARLFWEIRDRYNHGPSGAVHEDKLEISRRSDVAIVQAVEAVLNPAVVSAQAEEFRFAPGVVDAWKQAWVEHRPRPGAAEGYAEFLTVAPDSEDGNDTADDALARKVLETIRRVDPLARGLECAILVRTRDELARYVALLKGEGIPVAAEGKINPCLATNLGVVLLSLAKFVACPLDVISRGHLVASPLGSLLGTDDDALRLPLLSAAAGQGFAATFRDLVARAAREENIAVQDAEDFLAAAADYDASRSDAGDWRSFINFIEHRALEESEAPGAIRVMTIHNSKGLGVDMVILPELGGKAMTEFRDSSGVVLHRDAGGDVRWGMALPRKEFCEADPVLREAREEMRGRQSYEALCVLYVAMTRAKHALYCFAVCGRNDKNTGNWLGRTFPPVDEEGGLRALGDASWFEKYPVVEIEAPIRVAEPSSLGGSRREEVVSPSRSGCLKVSLADILTRGPARRLGIEVHELLARIGWIDEVPPALLDDANGQARKIVQYFLASAAARTVLGRPNGAVNLWRERAFDVVLDGSVVSGVFDRVVVRLSETGQAVSADIYDFKLASPGQGLNARHAAQLLNYRQAAASLLGLPLEKVTAEAVGLGLP